MSRSNAAHSRGSDADEAEFGAARGSRLVSAVRIACLAIFTGAVVAGLGDVAFAQAPTAARPSATPAATEYRKQGSYPPMPDGAFYRGNSNNSGDSGFYINLFGLLLVLLAFAGWVATIRWVDQDARGLKVRPSFWNTVVFAVGAVGFLLAMSMPMFVFTFFTLLVAYAVPVGLYVNERNGHVPESGKVLTPRHIRNVTIRTLASLGIKIGSAETQEAAIGPPINFIGKTVAGRHDDEGRSRQVENSRGYLAAKELVYDAILRRSTDIHLEPKDGVLAVRLRIDGVMYPTEPFDSATGGAIINIFKVLGAMDITEKRRPQDGGFGAELEGRDVDFRVATQGTRHGEKLSLRILDQANSVSTLAGLGLRKQLLEKLEATIHLPHGLLLVCGPTGAGKSTTLYAALNSIDAYQKNVITVEDPIEYKIPNVNQIEVNERAGQTFAKALRSILRQDPDVVMIGEIRDNETGSIACQAANTGHMVFSTVHANDTIMALFRLIELGVEPYIVGNSVSAVIGQRLVRRLCPDCKEGYHPNPEFVKKAGLPPDKIDKFYRPPTTPREEPCERCGGLGYLGRIGVFEVLFLNDRIRALVRDKADMNEIKAEARRSGMLSMKEEGLRLVIHGVTSIDELLRVVK